MGWWQLDTDTLAGSRFVVSAYAETTACLLALHKRDPAHPGERGWLDTHAPAYDALLADEPVTAAMMRAAVGRGWIADFLTRPPLRGDDEATLADEFARVRALPPAEARADLEVSNGGPLRPPLAGRDDLARRAADLLQWVWTHTVEPYWPRRRRLIEAEAVGRIDLLGRGGWAAAVADMRPGMRWLGAGRLQVNAYDYPPRAVDPGAELLFVPVTMRQFWVAWDHAVPARRYAVFYPCAGPLAHVDDARAPASLGRLLGRARADVLALLATPLSTTQLVAVTDQGLGSVGRHLKVLLDAGLIERRRAGRSVLYYRTTAGDVLIGAQPDAEGLRELSQNTAELDP
ncbi:helix-turn-helix domain-containing protein [Yinghuangia seranimata]|uniref:helix-turn-helix domain-containing protein n=1 Tax=Yinghuangia seranimata TaxID=408067 RepID=UPI00248A9738|nr:helix-turn-helix domain-containing protein [Yinghuangia seranimata]MDI2128568.1 helix-turn-helix domain-containing protein [Yinghuangia seranimata]